MSTPDTFGAASRKLTALFSWSRMSTLPSRRRMSDAWRYASTGSGSSRRDRAKGLEQRKSCKCRNAMPFQRESSYVSGHRSQNSLRAIARRLPDPRPGQHLRNIRRRVAALGEGLTQQPARPRVEVDAHARGKKTGAFAALGRMRGGLRHQRAEATGKDIP